MPRSNSSEWVDAYIKAAEDGAYSPRELRARALYYAVLGYSSRDIEAQLTRDFPGQKVPPFGVIARWNRSRPANRIGMMRMADVIHRSAVLLEQHMDRIDFRSANLMEVFTLYERSHALLDRSREAALLYR
jgi:hypothetical protein